MLTLLAASTLATSSACSGTGIPSDAKKTASGISYKVVKAGAATMHPTAMSTVTVHYTGWTMDGKQFDSSYDGGQPATFSLMRVIPGWVEALQLMVVGDKTTFWIPGNLAYDNSDRPDAPRGMLKFDIELIAIR